MGELFSVGDDTASVTPSLYNRYLRVQKLFPVLLALLALWSGTALAKTHHGAKASTRRGAKATSRSSKHRSSQQAPTPERYREIQQALAGKGYFTAEPNGAWGADSVQALKRFQHEQNLSETGKLDSVSLIALGLGPKRSTTAQLKSQPTQKRLQ
jgi:hypothetical protein